MGHHHKKHRNRVDKPQTQALPDPSSSADLGGMLKNLNLGDIDLSKLDMNKVQAMMEKMKSQGIPGISGDSQSNSTLVQPDQRLIALNALKEIAPNKKTKKIDKIIKLLQIADSLNIGSTQAQPTVNRSRRKHRN